MRALTPVGGNMERASRKTFRKKHLLYIKKSETADTRTCDVSKVSKETLIQSSCSHRRDVAKGLEFFINLLKEAARDHDIDKLKDIDTFYNDFKTKFEKHEWWDRHKLINRHHISDKEGIPSDIDLVDVLEYITDCVMAGLARSGKVYELKIDSELLQKAFNNTVELLKSSVNVDK